MAILSSNEVNSILKSDAESFEKTQKKIVSGKGATPKDRQAHSRLLSEILEIAQAKFDGKKEEFQAVLKKTLGSDIDIFLKLEQKNTLFLPMSKEEDYQYDRFRSQLFEFMRSE